MPKFQVSSIYELLMDVLTESRTVLCYEIEWRFSGQSFLINVRFETASKKPVFKEIRERYCCIVTES